MDGINIPEAGTVAACKMLIGGEWKPARSGQVVESINPATEEVIATVPHAEEADIDDAVQSGKEAFKVWRGYSWKKRQRILLELADRMTEYVERFALLDTIDSGNPYTGMLGDAE